MDVEKAPAETAMFLRANTGNKDKNRSTRCACFNKTVCLCVSCALNFVFVSALAIAAAFLLTEWLKTHSNKCHNIDKYSVCIPCSATFFSGDESVDWERVSGARDDEQLCCVKDAKYLQYLVRMMYLRENVEKQLPQTPSSPSVGPNGLPTFRSRIGAHCFLNDTVLQRHKMLAWDCARPAGQGSAFRSGDITINNGKLVVPEGGHYYIYSFLTYRSFKISSEENLFHSMYRDNPHKPNTPRQTLLVNKQARLSGSLQYQTSFLGSAVRLSKGDSITVGVNNISAVYVHSMSNYFGVFAL